MNDTSPRVALLARAGAARESVRGALLEIGADVVVEADPATVAPESIREAEPRVLMVVLDPVGEDALERLDEVLADPRFEVMFEEAEIAAAREGWEAARWRRHLAAKLLGRGDVLPPVAGAGAALADPLSAQLEELIATGDDGLPEVGITALDAPAGGSDFSVFDAAAADEGPELADGLVLTVDGLELESAAIGASAPVTGPDFRASDFDPLLAELDAELPAAAPAGDDAAFDAGGFDPAAFDATTFDAASFDATSFDASAFDAGAFDPQAFEAADFNAPPAGGDDRPAVEAFDFDAPVSVQPHAQDAGNAASDAAAVAPASLAFGELSLVEDDAPLAARPVAAGAVAPSRLEELERRIASLELVDDAAPNGAVLVLAGIGGPDAVRQLLGALPAGFPRAVLVRQRLDGARYDKLVTQLQRASVLPVNLAVAGQAATVGTVHVLADDVGVEADGGLRFVAGSGDVLDTLAAASSGIVVLSGADAADVPRIAQLKRLGAYVAAQATDGCYDPTACQGLVDEGVTALAPADIARQLAQRWKS